MTWKDEIKKEDADKRNPNNKTLRQGTDSAVIRELGGRVNNLLGSLKYIQRLFEDLAKGDTNPEDVEWDKEAETIKDILIKEKIEWYSRIT
jgi:hypothetical protein